jgi:predicted PurR-regulated permease PerM
MLATSPTPLAAAAWLATLLMLGLILAAGRDVLIPLALALLIWHLINAIARHYGRLRVRGRVPERRWRLFLAVLTIVLALLVVMNLIVRNVGAVSAAAPVYEANLLALLPRLADALGLPAPQSVGDLIGQIDLDVWIRSLSSALAAFVSSIGLVALYVAFLLVEQEIFDRKIDALFPAPDKAASVRRLLGQLERRIERYLWIKTLLSVATAVLSWCVLAAAGCQNASFWALVIFMLNYIPFVGSVMGVLFPALLILVQFGSFGPFLAVTAGLTVIQFGLGNVVEPRLMGSSLNLSPMAIIVSLAVWGGLWGVAGMFLCVPIMVIVMIVCAHFATTRPLAILLSADGRLDQDIPEPGPALDLRPARP